MIADCRLKIADRKSGLGTSSIVNQQSPIADRECPPSLAKRRSQKLVARQEDFEIVVRNSGAT
jgi:hypothetical protein